MESSLQRRQPSSHNTINNIINAIVTTTIHLPTKALKMHAERLGWDLIVVGDVTTPHAAYDDLNCKYLSPSEQEKLYPELSMILGWRTITRRNIGLLYAYQQGYQVVATVDDDNIPFPSWGQNIYVGKTVEIDAYQTTQCVFDPMPIVGFPDLWHRGFPWELLSKRDAQLKGKQQIPVLVQADLWNGDPDVDAVCRMVHKPEVKIADFAPFTSNALMPFNSQNTFLHRSVIHAYMMLTGVGRVQDIWGAYLLQQSYPNCVIYSPPTVYQQRNEHDMIDDLENELIQYRMTHQLVKNLHNWRQILPKKTVEHFDLYQTYFAEQSL